MKHLSVTISLFLLAGILAAQEILPLEKAISIGLENNFGIRIARYRQQEAANNATPGNAGMLPKINADASYLNGLSNAKVMVVSGSELENSRAGSDLITAGIYLDWTLFDGLGMFVTWEKLKKLEEKGILDTRIEVENTLAKIIGAYYYIIFKEKEKAILEVQVSISRFRLDLAQLEYETGSGSELEFLKANVELNADISELENQRTEYLNSKTILNELLSRDVNTPFGVADTIIVSDSLVYDSLRADLRRANRHLLRAEIQTDVSMLDMKSVRAKQYPKLDFITTFSYYRSETEANFISYNRNFGPAIGARASINLFDGRNLNRQYKNAQLAMKASELEADLTETRLDAWLSRGYNNYRNELQLIGFEQENLILALKNMDIAKESYKVGSISSLQLREIQMDLLNANLRLVNAEFRAKLSEIELILLSGKLIK